MRLRKVAKIETKQQHSYTCHQMSAQCTLEAVFHVCLQFMSRWHRYHRLSFLVCVAVKRWFVPGINLSGFSRSSSCWDILLKRTMSLYRTMSWYRMMSRYRSVVFLTDCDCIVQICDWFSILATGTRDMRWHMVLQPHLDLLHSLAGAGRHLWICRVFHFVDSVRIVWHMMKW